MLPAIGSSKTAATWPGNRARASATAAASLNGQRIVSRTAPAVTPGLLGVPSVVAAEPAWTSKAVDVPMVVAGHLDDLRPAGDPAATRTADIVASVPDETNRTFSIDGTAAATVSAISISRTVGAPKLEPRSSAVDHGRSHLGMRVAQNHRAPRADVIDVRVAVDVVEVGPCGAGDERRFAADRAERPRRAVDAARDHTVGPYEGLMALGKPEVGSGQGGGRWIHRRCSVSRSRRCVRLLYQASAINSSQLFASRMRSANCSSRSRSVIPSILALTAAFGGPNRLRPAQQDPLRFLAFPFGLSFRLSFAQDCLIGRRFFHVPDSLKQSLRNVFGINETHQKIRGGPEVANLSRVCFAVEAFLWTRAPREPSRAFARRPERPCPPRT